MKKGFSRVVALFAVFCIVQFAVVSAADVYLHIFTRNPGYGLVVRIQESEGGGIVDSAYGRANESGEALVNFTSSRAELFYTVIIVNNGVILESKEFGPLSTGTPAKLWFYDAEASASATSTASETAGAAVTTSNVTTNESSVDGTVLSGNAVNETAGYSFNYYILGGVLIGALVLGLIVRQVRVRSTVPRAPHDGLGKARAPRKPSVPKTLATQSPQPSTLTGTSPSFNPSSSDPLDQRIVQLEREIARLKKEESLVEAERRFESARKELDRLRAEQQRRDNADSGMPQ